MVVVAEAGMWGMVSQKEDGESKEKRGSGDRAWGSSHFEEVRRRQRSREPRVTPFSSQAPVLTPGVKSSRDEGVKKE